MTQLKKENVGSIKYRKKKVFGVAYCEFRTFYFIAKCETLRMKHTSYKKELQFKVLHFNDL